MQRLSPLVVGLLMAVPAILCRKKGRRLQKVVSLDSRISGQREVTFQKWIVISSPHVVCVGLAHLRFFLARVFSAGSGVNKQGADGAQRSRKQRGALRKAAQHRGTTSSDTSPSSRLDPISAQ